MNIYNRQTDRQTDRQADREKEKTKIKCYFVKDFGIAFISYTLDVVKHLQSLLYRK